MKKKQKSKAGQKTKKGQTKSKRKEPLWMWAGLGICIVIGVTAYFIINRRTLFPHQQHLRKLNLVKNYLPKIV